MKHLITLISALVFISVAAHADDTKKHKRNKQSITVAPFVWGEPGENAPEELASLRAVKMEVPVAPFVWGDAADAPQIVENSKIHNASVPVAPFILGNPDDEISLDRATLLAAGNNK